MVGILAILLAFFCGAAHANPQELRVEKDQATVYSEPSGKAPVLGHLPKGKRAHLADEEGDFFRVRSRSGKDLWVHKSDLTVVTDAAPYDVTTDVQSEMPGREPNFKRIRLDMGASGGRFQNESIVEGAFGVEYFMMERLSLRNALFLRRAQVSRDYMGLDISVRGNGNLPLGALGLRGIIGAGYRFTTTGEGAPFGEVGGFAALRGFDIGVMMKYVVNSVSNREDGVIYSIVFSGAAGFF